ncbi:MAG: tetratricopeptide repeat protein [Candidatus Coatesbacteria bacterium]|nr:MAG: tetratricopeptide repeat protein [Candidatus Coatesbacteria bacterium]
MRTIAIGAIILLAAAAGAQEAPPLARPAVTVLPFVDESPVQEELPAVPGMPFDPEAPMPWLADGLPGLLELAFQRAASINVVPRADFALALRKRRGLELAADTPLADVTEVAAREGITHVVGGSFYKDGKDLEFKIRIWPVGEEIAASPELEAMAERREELHHLAESMRESGEEMRELMADTSLSWDVKKTRAAEIKTRMDSVSERMAELTAEIASAVPPEFTVEIDEERLAEMEELSAELHSVVTDPKYSAAEKEARMKELRARLHAYAQHIAKVVVVAPKGRSQEFAGNVEEVFALSEAAAKYVLSAAGAGAGAGLIAREPTADLGAFKWFAKGTARYFTGEQISFFLNATQQDPNFAEAHLMLAEAYRKEKNFSEAKPAYERARELADYYPAAPVGLAALARKEDPENVDAAAYLYNEALALDPSYAPVFDGQGGMYFASGDYEAAREAYEKFVAVWPSNKDGYYALGNTLWLLGKDSPEWKALLREAIENYDQSLAIDPDFAAAHYNLASVYKIFEDVDNAIFHYRRYIELEPDSPKRAEIEETLADWEAKYGPK